MKPAVLLLALLVASAPTLAQHRQGQGQGQQGRGASQMSHEERQRLRQDVDSARGNYSRRDARRRAGPRLARGGAGSSTGRPLREA
jgi:hypothetical protein